MSTTDAEKMRLRDVLKLVYNDIQKKRYVNPEETFVEHYTQQVLNRTHPTHVMLKLDMDFYRGGSYQSHCVVSNEYFRWLNDKEPEVCLGEVNGKHSEVTATWDDYVMCDDYYEVEANMCGDKYAENLEDLYEEWMQKKGEPNMKFCEEYIDKKIASGELPKEERDYFYEYYAKPAEVVWGGGRTTEECAAYIDEKIAELKQDRKYEAISEEEEEEKEENKKRRKE